ncbi:hypothetical protein AB0K47_02815 [Streptomyces tirandamycinicus]|uniref:Uncharacterized protein n=1 Tax=Streptomyces tirandamycinicus TaxID=2174846 RepID=A0A2S1SPR3_9ACTN|nr:MULTISPECIES: hypothetical protein [Streptomyces]AWI28393.1 hypothetical protein DDW44_06015 [Streptomyces tirandamycinicus]MCY0984673.1 hypothetical protein [Streptomyces tirandamycinicus]TFE42866.1 hypothetical protein E3E14_23845 [Streptomyces sp. ICN441]
MKTSLALPLCALALVPAVLTAPPVQADTGHDKDRVKKFTLTTTDSQGDFPHVTADLLDRKGEYVGFVTTNCVEADSTPATVTCYGSYVLEDGEITWQHATRDPEPPYFIAITGGTGKYCEARGQIRVVRIESDPEGGRYDLEVITGRTCATS